MGRAARKSRAPSEFDARRRVTMSGDINLGRIFGIPFRLHWSWFLAIALIAWTLSIGFFPTTLPEHHGDRALYWGLGLAAALGLFASVLLHEMGHAAVARAYGIPVRGIRLFIFGGVAELGGEPKRPGQEILVAIAGPVVTVILIILFELSLSALVSVSDMSWRLEKGILGLHGGTKAAAASAALLFYLGFINLMLLIFNVIPAFPLDGGRVLRGIIWAATGNYVKATRIAGAVGIGFAYLLFVGGFYFAMNGDLIGGLWLFFLGMFLQNAARSSIAFAQLQELTNNVTVADMMNPHPITIDAHLSLREAIEEYFLHYPHKAYPVVDGSHFIGVLTLRDIQEAGRDRWEELHAGDLAARQVPLPELRPDDSVIKALRLFAESDQSRLPVVENGHLVGLLCARDVMDLMEIRAGLSPDRGRPAEAPQREMEDVMRRL
jgi:Zn-dependent protease/predicted transcriptional regulator